VYNETLKVVVQSLSFVDVNFDGLIDMVTIVSKPDDPSTSMIEAI
jgi:hypothetical protein